MVAFSDDSGQLPGWIVARDSAGEWSPYLTSETTNNEARLEQMINWNVERLDAPNATVRSTNQIQMLIDFNPDAPIPAGAEASTLIADPVAEPCDHWVDFSGGAIGNFRLLVLDAAGIGCVEVQEIAQGFPFFMTGEWSCAGDQLIRCERGDTSFTLERVPAGTPHPNAGQATSNEDTSTVPAGDPFQFVPGEAGPTFDPSWGEFGDGCGAISFIDGTDAGFTSVDSTDFTCEEAEEIMMTWLLEDTDLPTPNGFDCSSVDVETGMAHDEVTCVSAEGTITFNWY